jgi:hypothetical protein
MEREAEMLALVAECEQVLLGRYVERLEGLGQPVPVWAWTNLLAHGEEVDLRGRTAPPSGRWSRSSSDWEPARSFLAGEVLDLIDGGPLSLMELQRSVLIPLELELAANADVAHWRPEQLVTTVLAVLQDARSRRRR